jgi:hypothetical protein
MVQKYSSGKPLEAVNLRGERHPESEHKAHPLSLLTQRAPHTNVWHPTLKNPSLGVYRLSTCSQGHKKVFRCP